MQTEAANPKQRQKNPQKTKHTHTQMHMKVIIIFTWIFIISFIIFILVLQLYLFFLSIHPLIFLPECDNYFSKHCKFFFTFVFSILNQCAEITNIRHIAQLWYQYLMFGRGRKVLPILQEHSDPFMSKHEGTNQFL